MRKLGIGVCWLASLFLLYAALPSSAAGKISPSNQSLYFSGRVTDANRKPVAGAQVRCYWVWWENEVRSREGLTTLADKNGRYTIRISPDEMQKARRQAGAYWLRLEVVALHPGMGVTNASVSLEEIPGSVNLQLGREKILRGTVKDSAGNAVPNTELYVTSINDKIDGMRAKRISLDLSKDAQFLKATTDAQGRFVMRNLPFESHVWLWVSPRQTHLAQRACKVVMDSPAQAWAGPDNVLSLSANEPVAITLKPAVTLKVQALLGNMGKPASNAVVTIRAHNYGATKRTDSRGEISLNHVPPGLTLISINPPISETSLYVPKAWRSALVAGRTATFIKQLDRGTTLHGRVRDAASGKPLGKIAHFYRDEEADAEEIARLYFEAPIRSDGTFDLALVPGKYNYGIAGLPDGYDNGEIPEFKIEAGQTPSPLHIKLKRSLPVASSIKIKVVDAQNKPLENAVFYNDLDVDFRTNAHGVVAIHELPSGTDPLLVSHEVRGLAAVVKSIDAREKPARVSLQPVSKITGKVVDAGGQGVRDAKIVAMLHTGNFGSGIHSAVTDSSGNYRMKLFPDAAYTLTINAPGYGQTEVERFRTKSGQTTTINPVTLIKADLTVSGKVVDESGKPIAGAWVNVLGPGQYEYLPKPITDQKGYFHADGLVPGKIRVSAQVDNKYSAAGLNTEAGSQDLVVVYMPRKEPPSTGPRVKGVN